MAKGEMISVQDAPIFDVDEAAEFIADLTGIDQSEVLVVLEAEEEYMRKVGIISDFPKES